MVQFDGSYHDRLGTGQEQCLLIGVDDASGDTVHATFGNGESLVEVIRFWKEYFEKHGKPSIIYLDRHASYKVNHRKDQFDQTTRTRFQTAMHLLGIQVIYATSPEGKGRVERRFGMLQDRGIKELRLAGITEYREAEQYLQQVLIPRWNKQFSVKPVTP